MVKKKDRKKEKPSSPMLNSETKRGIVSIALFLAAVLLTLAYAGLGGRGGDAASHALYTLLGSGFLLVPLSLILASLSVFTSLHERFYAPTFIGATLFLVSLEGVLHLFFRERRGGGYIGYAIAEPLHTILSFWPTLVLLTGFIVISLITAFNIPLRTILFTKLREKEKKKEAPAYLEDRKSQPASAETLVAREAGEAEQGAEQTKKGVTPVFEMQDIEVEKTTPVSRKTRQRGAYVFPPINLLEEETGEPSSGDIKTTASVIRRALATFGIEVEMGEVNVGPTVTQYTLRPASGVKLSRITALQSDLSLALAAHPIRIEAPIPGRSLVGIEIPNTAIMVVRLRNLIADEALKKQSRSGLAISIGRDVAGSPVYGDLERMPHLLIAGATGSGKSICIHSILAALLYQNAPDALRFILIDPKRVELTHYDDIPHLLTPVIMQPTKTIHALRWAVREMERRYEELSNAGARDLQSYNARHEAARLPYIIIVIDELADIMASFGRDVEGMIVRLAQMARAVGIHLIVSTQRPSVEVITGLIKANITTRIAFQVASQVDSRTILDMSGAEKLLGRGDMLYLAYDAQKPRRVQSAYVSEKEVNRICDFIREHNADYAVAEEDITTPASTGSNEVSVDGEADGESEDDASLVREAKKLVRQTGKASATFLQRRLKIGYARAARLLDILEARGVVGPGEGAKPREVYGTEDRAQDDTYHDDREYDNDDDHERNRDAA